jgi:hypothetical protein
VIWNIITKFTLLVFATALLAACSLDDEPNEPYGNPDVDQSIHPKEGPNGKWGYVDKNGKWLIAPQYAYAFAFTDNIFDKHNGEAGVQLWGTEAGFAYIDKTGKIVSKNPSP